MQEELDRRVKLSGRSMNEISLAVGWRKGKSSQPASSTLVRDIISGKSQNPNINTIALIAEELGCTARDLCGKDISESTTSSRILVRTKDSNISPSTPNEKIISDCKALATHFVKKGVLDKEIKDIFFNELLGERLFREEMVQEGKAISNNLSISEIETLLEQANHIGVQR